MNVTSMHPTPTTRSHHALRWVLGVGLVFVVVVGMAWHVTQPRADERWEQWRKSMGVR